MNSDTQYQCLICGKVGAGINPLGEWRSKTKCRRCYNKQNYAKYKDTTSYWKKNNEKNLIKS